ncbi:odorant receptor 22c [Scaptodrosophila lebanonensis]|uniref:Odorant receptor n=1 Tax=Drosophila lebanonensis TaxID=7225 RepID=A0A6J2U7X9_DROLE|nr:odorant receptor 22c [Scaptodrosophila lebanonensis]
MPSSALARGFYHIPSLPGHVVGIWPQERRAFYVNLVFGFSFFVVLMGAVGENLYGVLYISNLVTALEAFCPGTTKAVCVLKMTIFFVHNREWHSLVQRLRKMMWAADDAADQHMLAQLSKTANKLALLLLVSGSLTNTAFNLQPLVMHAYRRWYGLPRNVDLPFNIILPDFSTKQPMFPFTYALLTSSGFCTVCVFSSVDGFFLCSYLYICGVFRLVQHNIRSIFVGLHDGESIEFYSPSVNALIQGRLKVIIERHNAIIDLCTDLTRQFTVIVLMHFLSAAFVLCTTILDIMLNSASLSGLTYICYSVAALTQLFIYCYGGNHVSESSAAVADTLYDIEWYKCDVKTRKMILMILRRAQRAKTIAVPFFTPSLPAFSSILSTTGSYITLLKTFL